MWLRVFRNEISELPVELCHWNRKLRPAIPERVPWIFLTQFSWPEPFNGHKNSIPTHESSTSEASSPTTGSDFKYGSHFLIRDDRIGRCRQISPIGSKPVPDENARVSFLRNPLPAMQNAIPLSVVISTDKNQRICVGAISNYGISNNIEPELETLLWFHDFEDHCRQDWNR